MASSTWRRLWYGEPSATPDLQAHESTLEALRVATELQNGSAYDWRWKVAAVYRGAQMLSDLMAQLPWYAYQGGPMAGQQLQEMPERLEIQPAILLRPDPFISRGDWIRQTVLSLIWRGNAYVWKSGMGDDGRPSSVQTLDPDQMAVSWDARQLFREYAYRSQKISRQQLDHIGLNWLPGALKGIGPLDAGRDTVYGQVFADKFARDLFAQDGIPSGKLMHPGKLNGPEATELLKEWQKGQAEGRKTAVLSGGMDYEPLSLTPDQAQMLQSRAFGVAEIARLLGIPAHLLNAATGIAGASGASMTYQNVTQVATELVRFTLLPVYGARLEELASSWLPRGQSVMFDTHELERADEAGRYNAYAVALGSSFLTVDEVREQEGRPPSAELKAEREAGRRLAEDIAQGGSGPNEAEEAEDEQATADAEG
jgi:HK97 family phage portal protein